MANYTKTVRQYADWNCFKMKELNKALVKLRSAVEERSLLSELHLKRIKMSIFGIVLFLCIFGMAFWLLLFLLGFIVPYWITLGVFEKMRPKRIFEESEQ